MAMGHTPPYTSCPPPQPLVAAGGEAETGSEADMEIESQDGREAGMEIESQDCQRHWGEEREKKLGHSGPSGSGG